MYGTRVQESVLAAGDKEAGCTVHYVSAEVDGGRIIAQSIVSVQASDTPETLALRVQQEEKKLLPQIIGRLLAD
jgi:phosphoribosylglycinamide formyltransferase-1